MAKRLNFYYADQEIISKAAEKLSILEKDAESIDEKLQSFWQTYLEYSAIDFNEYIPPNLLVTSTFELYRTEAEVIKNIANNHSAIIIGRCGFHILREHPNCLNIFLYADNEFRIKRIQKLYNTSEKDAAEMITKSDKERAHYIKTFTGIKWEDTRQYHLSMDTSKFGIEKTINLIVDFVK